MSPCYRQISAGMNSPLRLVNLLLASIIGMAAGVASAQEPEEPDPRALLEQVAQARASLRSGRLDMEIRREVAPLPESWTEIWSYFDGPRLQWSVVRSGGHRNENLMTRAFLDADQCIEYNNDLRVIVRRPNDPSITVWAQPRALGLGSLGGRETVRERLHLHDGVEFAFNGYESIAAVECARVKVVDANQAEYEFWIGPAPARQVHRYEWHASASDNTRPSWRTIWEVVSSEFDTSTDILPSKLIHRSGTAQQTEDSPGEVNEIAVTRRELNVDVPAFFFSIAGLYVPNDAVVIEADTEKILGYWDGTTVRQTKTRPYSLGLWSSILVICLLISVIIGALLLGRRQPKTPAKSGE